MKIAKTFCYLSLLERLMKSTVRKCTVIGLMLGLLLHGSCKNTMEKKIPPTSVSSDQFADSIITKLSLEEKVALIHGMGGGNSEFGDLNIQFFGIKGNEEKGIPPLYMGHGITGVRSGRDTTIHATYFKTPIAMGCSWDTELYSEVGTAIAKEMRALGQDLNLGPTLNIIRHPLGGRNWESFSEDPFLTSAMVVPYVKAMQSNGVICGPKHFVANNQETNRFDINNEVDERTLREIYLPAFKAAVKEGGALNIMGAYNRVNGTYMCHNKYLLDDVLRGEWGFEGFVLSDFVNGIKNTKAAVNARMNVEMHRPKFYGAPLVEEVEKGNISETKIDELLKDVLKVMHTMKLFDRERYENPEVVHSPSHIALSRKVAQSTSVLLQNKERILPLNISTLNSVAVIGPNAKRYPSVTERNTNYAYYLQGGGSGRTYYFHNTLVTPYVGLINSLKQHTSVYYAQGCKTPDLFAKNKELPFDAEEKQLIAEAVAIAKKSEIAIVYAGLSGFNETEGWDKLSSSLPGQQNRLIKEVAKVNPNTIVVVIAGSSIDVMPWIDDVKSVLYVPYCGEQIGNGIADVLSGKVNPSGKLPFTWPLSINDYPENSIFTGAPYTDEGKSNVYTEGIFVGYRWFDKENIKVKYPFGFGLSYTTFKYNNLKIIDKGDSLKEVKVTIQNTGKTGGKEVVQVYIKDIEASVLRPEKELKGFAKVLLEAGESKEVTINLPKKSFSFYDVKTKDWAIENGDFEILVGADVDNIQLKKSISLN